MLHNAQEFLGAYEHEAATTEKVLRALTNESLAQSKAEGHPNAGDIAWHIASSPRYIYDQISWPVEKITDWATPADLTVDKIVNEYCSVRDTIKRLAGNVTPEDLQKVHNVFGAYDWPAWMLLQAHISHEIHHRGQLSVLMRQAGLSVPAIYGPNFEQTTEMMKAMAAEQS